MNGKANTADVYTIAAADLQFTTRALDTALVTAVGLKAVATDVIASLLLKCENHYTMH